MRTWLGSARALGFEILSPAGRTSIVRARTEGVILTFEPVFASSSDIAAMRVVANASLERKPLALEVSMLSWSRTEEGGARSFTTGDPWFDSAVLCEGSADRLSSILDERTRAEIRRLVPEGALRFGGSTLVAVMEDRKPVDREVVLAAIVRCARFLAERPRVTEGLARIAATDRLPGVRRRALELLIERHPVAKEVPAALNTALDDPSPGVRLVAARQVGKRGVPVLAAIADDPGAEDGDVAEAIRSLGRDVAPEVAGRVLERARKRGRKLAARAAIERLARSRSATAREPLERALRDVGSPVAVEAARALASLGFEESVPLFVERLGVASLDEARALVSGLERGGGAAVVPALRAAGARFGKDRAFQRQVELAVRTIQARAPGAGAGQISLADDGAGRISLPPAEAGRLALAGPGAPPEQPT